jgi:hypothetical protein
MDPIQQAEALATEIQEMLQEQILDWPGLQDKLKEMRDEIGNCQTQYVYSQFAPGPITHTNPSDEEIEGMESGEINSFAEWVSNIEG